MVWKLALNYVNIFPKQQTVDSTLYFMIIRTKSKNAMTKLIFAVTTVQNGRWNIFFNF